MFRPFDKTTRKRHGAGLVDENEAGTDTNNVQGFKDRSFINTNNKNLKTNNNEPTPNKTDLLVRKKNINQALKEKQRSNTLDDNGKSSISSNEKSNVKKSQLKSLTPLKRPVSRGTSPTAKRMDVGQQEITARHIEIEHGYQAEQESLYIPDDISPIDFDLFDGGVNMDAYDTTALTELDTSPLHDIESFPTKRRQFDTTFPPSTDRLQLNNGEKEMIRQDITTRSPTPSFTLPAPIEDTIDHTLKVPAEIEYCPPAEQELPYNPDMDPVDLTMFSPSIHLSAYDLSKYFDDEQVEFPDDLFDDEDVSDISIDLVEDYGLVFDDVAVLFKIQDPTPYYDKVEHDIDYSEIPFSNHIFEDVALVV
ncbi:hypothetical protein BC941DRAFT_507923 [Chlamydoabsidia padenii]|nr:hypothetical protein BC941DRAFT_507923 [Chlamydoabsidia padenii]